MIVLAMEGRVLVLQKFIPQLHKSGAGSACPIAQWLASVPPVAYYVCMYGHKDYKSMDQPGMIANPARGQLNRENEYFPVHVHA